MPEYNLIDLAALLRSYGRGVVFYAPRWDRTTPLVLTHLGDTEGDIVINTNPEVAALTLPELTGPAAHEVDYMGENPTIEMPLFLAEPSLLAIVSPVGSAHAGRSRRGKVREYTIVIFPEALFLKDNAEGIAQRVSLEFADGAWTLDGVALTPAQQELLDVSFWLWRAYFNRAPRRFLGGAGDARKNIETVSVQGMHHPEMPEGNALYTTGDPAEEDINIEGES